MKKERHKSRWFSEFHPSLTANIFFSGFFLESHPMYDQTQSFGDMFSLLYGKFYSLWFFNF